MDALIRLAEAWWPLYAVHFIEVSLFILLVWAADRWMKLDTRLRYVLELVKRDSVWVLPGENPVKEGEGYRFIVNHNTSEVYDLRHSNAKQKSSRLIGFSSIYTGGEIVFDPSLYITPKRDSRAEFSANNGLQATFSRLVKEMKDIRKKGMTSYGKMLRSADVWDSTFIDQGNKLREIANQYPPYFEQFILKEKFDFLQRFHPHNRGDERVEEVEK